VLSTDTGHARNYASDPYGSYNPDGGYYESDNLMFSALTSDDRYDNKRVVMGARTSDGSPRSRRTYSSRRSSCPAKSARRR